jgi:hypothetical protein
MLSKFFKFFKKKPVTLSGDPNWRIMEYTMSDNTTHFQVEKYDGYEWKVYATFTDFDLAHAFFQTHRTPPRPSIVSIKEVAIWPRGPYPPMPSGYKNHEGRAAGNSELHI